MAMDWIDREMREQISKQTHYYTRTMDFEVPQDQIESLKD